MTKFEEDIKKIEEIVGQLERGEMSLEESIEKYEQGKKLARACYSKLKKAELKITQIEAPKEVEDKE